MVDGAFADVELLTSNDELPGATAELPDTDAPVEVALLDELLEEEEADAPPSLLSSFSSGGQPGQATVLANTTAAAKKPDPRNNPFLQPRMEVPLV